MRVEFEGNAPLQNYIRLGVVGNNLVDKLELVVKIHQYGVRLSDFTPSLKIQNDDLSYVDKIPASELQVEKIEYDRIKVIYTVPDKVTRQGSVDMQLAFERYDDDTVPVWQTQTFNVAFDCQIDASEIISKQYPAALRNLEKRVNELENAPTFTEYISFDRFPEKGTAGVIYIDTSDNTLYRWNDDEGEYVMIGFNPESIKIINANGGN